MQVNLNTNMSNQSFTAFRMDQLAEENLRKAIKPKNLQEFKDIVESQVLNPLDINLFGTKSGELYGRIIANNNYVKDAELSQWPIFESALKFLKRLAVKADKMREEIANIPDINIDTIFEKMKY